MAGEASSAAGAVSCPKWEDLLEEGEPEKADRMTQISAFSTQSCCVWIQVPGSAGLLKCKAGGGRTEAGPTAQLLGETWRTWNSRNALSL